MCGHDELEIAAIGMTCESRAQNWWKFITALLYSHPEATIGKV